MRIDHQICLPHGRALGLLTALLCVIPAAATPAPVGPFRSRLLYQGDDVVQVEVAGRHSNSLGHVAFVLEADGRIFGLDRARPRPVSRRLDDGAPTRALAWDGERLHRLVGGVIERMEPRRKWMSVAGPLSSPIERIWGGGRGFGGGPKLARIYYQTQDGGFGFVSPESLVSLGILPRVRTLRVNRRGVVLALEDGGLQLYRNAGSEADEDLGRPASGVDLVQALGHASSLRLLDSSGAVWLAVPRGDGTLRRMPYLQVPGGPASGGVLAVAGAREGLDGLLVLRGAALFDSGSLLDWRPDQPAPEPVASIPGARSLYMAGTIEEEGCLVATDQGQVFHLWPQETPWPWP